MASEENRKKTVPENVEDKPASAVSEHKTNNQQTPKKSKQPARRKAKSTFQPGFHGRLVQFVLYDEKAKPIEGLKNLFESLANRFDYDDVVNALLIEMAVADYWRLSKGLAHEIGLFGPRCDNFHPQGAMPVVIRYVATARRNLNTSMKMLLQLDKEAAEAKELAAETEEAETEASKDPAPMSQPTATPETSEEPSTPAASTTCANEAATAEPQPTAAESTAAESVAETPAIEGAGENPATDLPAAA